MSFAKFLLVALAVPSFAHDPITAKSLVARIDKYGASAVVKQLITPNENQWNLVMNRIEAGSEEWLEVAEKLQPGVDAGTSEDLCIVVARALVHNPNRVLKMVSEKWPVEQVCGDYEIEETNARIRSRQAAVRLAMLRVTEPDLIEKKKACLKAAETH